MTLLETGAIVEWRRWGDQYALFTRCTGCSRHRHCRGKRRRRMICLECWEYGPPDKR